MAHNAALLYLHKGPAVVQLNVGGTIYSTSRETLLKHESAGLRELLVSAEDGSLRLDASGRLFVDSNPRTFEVVLDFLRDGAAALPSSHFELQKLLIDARKFQVHHLEGQVLAALGHAAEQPAQVTFPTPAPVPMQQESSVEAGTSDLTVHCKPKRKRRAAWGGSREYLDVAQKGWETDNAFKLPRPLPDGSTHWPIVNPGNRAAEDTGRVRCRLCLHFEGQSRDRQFTSEEGYTGGKKSGLVQHQTRNMQHVAYMQQLVGGLDGAQSQQQQQQSASQQGTSPPQQQTRQQEQEGAQAWSAGGPRQLANPAAHVRAQQAAPRTPQHAVQAARPLGQPQPLALLLLTPPHGAARPTALLLQQTLPSTGAPARLMSQAAFPAAAAVAARTAAPGAGAAAAPAAGPNLTALPTTSVAGSQAGPSGAPGAGQQQAQPTTSGSEHAGASAGSGAGSGPGAALSAPSRQLAGAGERPLSPASGEATGKGASLQADAESSPLRAAGSVTRPLGMLCVGEGNSGGGGSAGAEPPAAAAAIATPAAPRQAQRRPEATLAATCEQQMQQVGLEGAIPGGCDSHSPANAAAAAAAGLQQQELLPRLPPQQQAQLPIPALPQQQQAHSPVGPHPQQQQAQLPVTTPQQQQTQAQLASPPPPLPQQAQAHLSSPPPPLPQQVQLASPAPPQQAGAGQVPWRPPFSPAAHLLATPQAQQQLQRQFQQAQQQQAEQQLQRQSQQQARQQQAEQQLMSPVMSPQVLRHSSVDLPAVQRPQLASARPAMPRCLSFPINPQRGPPLPPQQLTRQPPPPPPPQPPELQQQLHAQQAALHPAHPLSRQSLSKCLDHVFSSSSGAAHLHGGSQPQLQPPQQQGIFPPAQSAQSHQHQQRHQQQEQPATPFAQSAQPQQQQQQPPLPPPPLPPPPPQQQQQFTPPQVHRPPPQRPQHPQPSQPHQPAAHMPAAQMPAAQPPGPLALGILPSQAPSPMPGAAVPQQVAQQLSQPALQPPVASPSIGGAEEPHFVDTLLAHHSEDEGEQVGAAEEAAAQEHAAAGAAALSPPHSQRAAQLAALSSPGGQPLLDGPGASAGPLSPLSPLSQAGSLHASGGNGSPPGPSGSSELPPPPPQLMHVQQQQQQQQVGGAGQQDLQAASLPPPLHTCGGECGSGDVLEGLDESFLQSPTASLLCDLLGDSPPAASPRDPAHLVPDLPGLHLPAATAALLGPDDEDSLCSLHDGLGTPLAQHLPPLPLPNSGLLGDSGGEGPPGRRECGPGGAAPGMGLAAAPHLGQHAQQDLDSKLPEAAGALPDVALEAGGEAGEAEGEGRVQDIELLQLIHQSSIGASLPLLADLEELPLTQGALDDMDPGVDISTGMV